MSERASSRERHSRRHRRHRPRNRASTGTASGSQNGAANDPANPNQANNAILNGSSVAHHSIPQTPSDLAYSTTAPWIMNPVVDNNGHGSQHASSLQYLSAPDASSNVRAETTVDPNSAAIHGYSHNGQAQWSALHNYANAPPRDDAWSPWVMPIRDEAEEGGTEVGEDQDGDGQGREGSNQNGV